MYLFIYLFILVLVKSNLSVITFMNCTFGVIYIINRLIQKESMHLYIQSPNPQKWYISYLVFSDPELILIVLSTKIFHFIC